MKMDFNFNFDPDAKSNIVHVYHGTRISGEVIHAQGLRYPGFDHLINMIKFSMDKTGLSFSGWLEYAKKMDAKGKFNPIRELQEPYRQKIWVTDDVNNAWSYASHAPEAVTKSVRDEFIRLHFRRKNVLDQADEVVKVGTSWIGKPIVVVLDAKKLNTNGGCNVPIGEFIAPDVIVNILTEGRAQ